jgi:arylsulfatase A-like enzyme
LASLPGYESIECQPILRDLDYWRRFSGPWYGFQHVETARMHGCESHAGQHYAIWMEENGLTNWRDYFEDYPADSAKRERLRANMHWDLPERYHYTTWTGERTVAQIDKAAAEGNPFFVWASFHDPHPPYIVPEPWASMYDPADMVIGELTPGEHDANAPHFGKTQEDDPEYWASRRDAKWIHGGHSHLHDPQWLREAMACYYGMVSFMDAQIGRILDALDARGLTDNTLVVFTTDHGHFLGAHGLTAKAIHHYEDLLRVPFIVRHPGSVRAGATSNAIQNLVDLAPTFLAAAGIDVPHHMTGVDQSGTWASGEPTRHWSITENHHGTRDFHMRTYVTERYKLTVYRDGDDGELFDLVEDPAEVRNLWRDPAAGDLKGRMMHEFLQATLRSEPMRMPRIAGA